MREVVARFGRWMSAVVVGMLGAVVYPAMAWAQTSDVAELVRRRPRSIGFGGVLGFVCCLLPVLAVVAVIVVITMRRRQR